MPKLQFLDLSKNRFLKAIDRTTFDVNPALISLNFDETAIENFRDIQISALETLQIRSQTLRTFDMADFIHAIKNNTAVERFSLAIGGESMKINNLDSAATLDYLKELTIDQTSESMNLEFYELH